MAEPTRSAIASPPSPAVAPAPHGDRLGPLRARWQVAREALQFAARRAQQIDLLTVAGSLTFTTVLAIVPLLTVVLAIFASFPLFASFRVALETQLLRELLPGPYADTLLRWLSGFAQKAGQLTAVGLGFLLVTALAMVATVDRVLNRIWLVRQQRPLAQRIAIYWALLTLGPLLTGASLAAMSFVVSQSADALARLPAAAAALVDYLPPLLSGLAYAALYVIVPNRPVAWRDALIGGFAAALAGALMREGFAAYLRTGTVATLYGAFAVAPLFMIWVYLSWFVLLFGAAIAAVLPALRHGRYADTRRAGDDFATAVALLQVLDSSARSGAALAAPAANEPVAPPADELASGAGVAATSDAAAAADAPAAAAWAGEQSLVALARATRTALDDTERLLAELEALGYVRELGGRRTGRWRLVCDPAVATLRPLFERLAFDPAHSLVSDRAAWIGPATLDRLDWPLARLRG